MLDSGLKIGTTQKSILQLDKFRNDIHCYLLEIFHTLVLRNAAVRKTLFSLIMKLFCWKTCYTPTGVWYYIGYHSKDIPPKKLELRLRVPSITIVT